MITSDAASTMLLGAPRQPMAQQIPGTPPIPQVNIPLPSTAAPPPSIGERLQQLVQGVDENDLSTMSARRPPFSQAPLVYTAPPSEEGNRAYSVDGSTHSMPTYAPGM